MHGLLYEELNDEKMSLEGVSHLEVIFFIPSIVLCCAEANPCMDIGPKSMQHIAGASSILH